MSVHEDLEIKEVAMRGGDDICPHVEDDECLGAGAVRVSRLALTSWYRLSAPGPSSPVSSARATTSCPDSASTAK